MTIKLMMVSTFALTLILTCAIPPSASATKYIWRDCSPSDQTKIRAAVTWLKRNVGKIDDKMGRGGLMKWPGKSRKKFIKKLDKTLKIRCRSAKSKMCTPKEVDENTHRTTRGRVIPIVHQRRIDLCLNHIADSGVTDEEDAAHLTSVIAHEIAHLIRLNAHRKSCIKKYEKPKFSQSVGLATFHAYMKTRYRSSDYTSRCP